MGTRELVGSTDGDTGSELYELSTVDDRDDTAGILPINLNDPDTLGPRTRSTDDTSTVAFTVKAARPLETPLRDGNFILYSQDDVSGMYVPQVHNEFDSHV